MPSSSELPALSLVGVRKRFGGVQALAGVSLDVYAGKVVALVGENGAGKSTAVKVMTGVHQPDAGVVEVLGAPVRLGSAQAAWRHGIAAVHQDAVMFDELSVAENIFMGHLVRGRAGLLDWAGMRQRANAILQSLEADLGADQLLGDLGVAQKHLVEIARALSHDARVLILDEPTAALSRREVDDLYRIIRRLARDGAAILFISHRLDEIFGIADRYVVFRDGCHVAEGAIGDVDEAGLVRAMVGRAIATAFPKASVELGAPLLEVRGLGNDTEFTDISFCVRKAEVLGFYGLVGAGRTELMESLFGLSRPTQGEVTFDGRPWGASPREAIERGLVLVPEDRQRNGSSAGLSIRDNLTLPSLDKLARGPFIDSAAEAALASAMVARLSIQCATLDQPLRELSGGNQQKVVIGKWLATEPKLIILDEPTQGIDVGAKAAVHAFIGERVTRGVAVILVSSELPEVMAIADRIVVMHKGRIAAVFARADFDARAIVSAALGSGASFSNEVTHAESAQAS